MGKMHPDTERHYSIREQGVEVDIGKQNSLYLNLILLKNFFERYRLRFKWIGIANRQEDRG